jgi:hypothetical protein
MDARVGAVMTAIASAITIILGIAAGVHVAHSYDVATAIEKTLPLVGWVTLVLLASGGLVYVVVAILDKDDQGARHVSRGLLAFGLASIGVPLALFFVFGERTMGWVGLGFVAWGTIVGMAYLIDEGVSTPKEGWGLGGLIVLFALEAVCAVALITTSPEAIGLADCRGVPRVRPSEVTLACADGGEVVTRLRWTGWNRPFAAGQGLLAVNDCEPSCAAGGYHYYEVLLTAYGWQRCKPGGRPAYTTVRYWLKPTENRPFPPGSPGAAEPTVSFACKPRP